ncbi:hypothetical protein [Streptomyces sp. NPDC057426]|uniref:hypothetical protein n=1 Tax=Streptomyces sp. NPDC057426 TaxID=3346128 RepID=UPI0036C66E1F
MTLLPYFEVDVPIRNTARPGEQGWHVFTGQADSKTTAVRIAREVYDQAFDAAKSGAQMPGRRPDGWGVRGLRPGWELDWPGAIAHLWGDPHSWTRVSDFDL